MTESLIALVLASTGCANLSRSNHQGQEFALETLFKQHRELLVAHAFVGDRPSLYMIGKSGRDCQGDFVMPTPPVISFVWTYADEAGGKTYRCDFVLKKADVTGNIIENVRIILLPENKVQLVLARRGKLLIRIDYSDLPYLRGGQQDGIYEKDWFATYEGTGREISGPEIPPVHAIRIAKERAIRAKIEAESKLPPVLGRLEGGRYTSIDGMFSMEVPDFPDGGQVMVTDRAEGRTVGQNYLIVKDAHGRKLVVIATFVPMGGGKDFLDRYLKDCMIGEKRLPAGYFETGFITYHGERMIQSSLRDQVQEGFPFLIERGPDKRGTPSEALRWLFMRGDFLIEVSCLYPCRPNEDRERVKDAIRTQVEKVVDTLDTHKGTPRSYLRH